MVMKYYHGIPGSVCNIKQEIQYLQIHPICLTGSDRDYILDEIVCRDKTEYKINISVEDDKE